MRKTWFSVILSMVLLLSAISNASASPGHHKEPKAGHHNPPPKIHTSCGAASGTAKSPHKICKQSDLDLMRAYPDHYFVLNKNIIISGDWVPIEVFNGNLNGNHKSIHNLTNTFIITNNGSIKNLNLKNVNINDVKLLHIGSLSKFNYGRLSNINVSGQIFGYEDMAGITFFNNGLIEGATVNMDVKSGRFAGGIADINGEEGVIKRSSFSGQVSTSGGAGGIVSDNRGLIKDSIARGKVSINYCCNAGGIAGTNMGVIMNVIVAADVYFVSDDRRIGKVAGYNNPETNAQIIRTLILNHIYKNGVLVE